MTSTMDLSKWERFRKLTDSAKEEVKSNSIEMKVNDGDKVFDQGTIPKFLYMIGSGYVKMSRMSQEGRESLLGIFGPQDTVGEVALLNSKVFPANATAITDAKILKLSAETYRNLIAQNPEFSRLSIDRCAAGVFQFIARMDANQRSRTEFQITGFFDELVVRFGQRGADGFSVIPFGLSRQDIANAVNCRTETAIRIMRALEKESLILTKKNEFRISKDFASSEEVRRLLLKEVADLNS